MEEKKYEKFVEVSTKDVVNRPFRFLSNKANDIMKTGYEFYEHGKGKPLLGRWENGKFQVFSIEKKAWEERKYEEFNYEGEFVTTQNGEPVKVKKTRNYFKKVFQWSLEFLNEEKFQNKYDPTKKVKCEVNLKKARLELGGNIQKFIEEGLAAEGRRGGNPLDNYYVVTAQGTGVNVRYNFVFHSLGTPSNMPTPIQPKPSIVLNKISSLLDEQFVDPQDSKLYSLRIIVQSIREQGATDDVTVEHMIQHFRVPKEKAEQAVKLV